MPFHFYRIGSAVFSEYQRFRNNHGVCCFLARDFFLFYGRAAYGAVLCAESDTAETCRTHRVPRSALRAEGRHGDVSVLCPVIRGGIHMRRKRCYFRRICCKRRVCVVYFCVCAEENETEDTAVAESVAADRLYRRRNGKRYSGETCYVIKSTFSYRFQR